MTIIKNIMPPMCSNTRNIFIINNSPFSRNRS